MRDWASGVMVRIPSELHKIFSCYEILTNLQYTCWLPDLNVFCLPKNVNPLIQRLYHSVPTNSIQR
jgi:hypothetical protein